MSQRRSSFPFAAFVALLGLALAPHAAASQAYPEALRAELGLAEIPNPPTGCLLCHKDLVGGFMTVTKPFGRSVLKAGATGASVPSLRAALQTLETTATDSDFDGIADVPELQAGTDPNVAEVSEGEPPIPQHEEVPLPETGCSLSGAPAESAVWLVPSVACLWLARRRRTAARAALAFLTVLGAGCQGKSAAPAGPTASASAPAAPGAGDPLVHELEALGKTCKVSEDRLQCPDGANWKLIADFLAARRDRSAALGALVTTLSHDDPGVRALAVNVLRSAFGGQWGSVQSPARVDPDVAKRLLDHTFKLPTDVAQQVVPAAVNVAMLGGQVELLYAELAQPEHAALRPSAYPYLMTVGRSQTFAKVQQLVKEAAVVDATAAAEAPLNMPSWTEPERQQICEWSGGLLSDARTEIAVKAAQIVAPHCPGHWLDSLLERSEALAQTSKLDAAALPPLIAMCSRPTRANNPRGTDAQCRRGRALLSRVAESKRAVPAAREQAMKGLAKLWSDDATSRLLERLRQDSNTEVANGAREATKVLDKAALGESSGSP
jgi:hypothetical protein